MKKVANLLIFIFLISTVSISCTDKKKEDKKTKAAVEKIDAAEKEVETVFKEIETKTDKLEKDINTLDNL